ncbi:hypothetical protein GCM10010330_67700 [Streptomyces tendae]|uniref:hypothetical protein n=1 Tax=Streptomyces tendae TaxID=1932 RepID=UPI00167BA279|nr:hypothetical protein [Streptomyces tendae]GHB03834.1 hypothetical protein GCM10010330_67700 [Streptomyces tendae]
MTNHLTAHQAAAALHAAEDELAKLRRRVREVAAFLHDQAHDLPTRQALAQHLDLPVPNQ